MNAPHPSTFINANDVTMIRDNAAAAETLGHLHPAQLELVYRLQWFKLLVPGAYGGLELSLPNLVRLQEAISWADGSVGWVMTLCCGAGWFGGFMQPKTAKTIFGDPQVCLAGSGAVTGDAELTESGYHLTGTWNYASGADHATYFTANCAIKKNGEAVIGDDGQPLVLPFVIPKKDVALLPTWKYVGMVATGSHSFRIDQALLPADNSFRIDPAHAMVDGALYQYPFLQLAEATLAVNLSGMAIHFTDLCRDIFDKKVKQPKITPAHAAQMNTELASGVAGLQSAREELFSAVDASWEQPGEAQLKAVSKTSRALAILSRKVVDNLFIYCGLMAAAPDTEINRVWRDIHTAGQHALLTFAE
ncbi:acyl-CoA dehydrogenase [Mucilaginibacter mali]|uniref:Acyl-CoA dehydrogenase n=1 Tax=Mucilaginibacter mali TaxID=2740462 RepID=A0A7D4TYU4_9SPHI|nr:acyl-CoA dehydrogenase [Mucilaginibacter mali]QKJ31637.1 acyl-CoA dehydrogenase [Mucilaginibacter mali]